MKMLRQRRFVNSSSGWPSSSKVRGARAYLPLPRCPTAAIAIRTRAQDRIVRAAIQSSNLYLFLLGLSLPCFSCNRISRLHRSNVYTTHQLLFPPLRRPPFSRFLLLLMLPLFKLLIFSVVAFVTVAVVNHQSVRYSRIGVKEVNCYRRPRPFMALNCCQPLRAG
jgi:hypothetical protein